MRYHVKQSGSSQFRQTEKTAGQSLQQQDHRGPDRRSSNNTDPVIKRGHRHGDRFCQCQDHIPASGGNDHFYQNGDTALIRDYVMPEKNDDIDMFVNENSSSYYEKYFILGKYSDMNRYIKGDDIYFEYYWYQNTDEGPALVYKSTAKNTDTTSGQRYRNDLWELFELSYRNIDIISYDEYPRTKDYYEVYRDWKNKDRDSKEKENLEEKIDIYCECGDEDELYSEYEEDFDSWEEAADFWEEYCD